MLNNGPFFYQITFAIDALNRWRRPVAAGKTLPKPLVTLIMQVVTSLVLLVLGSYLIVSGADTGGQKTGYSLIGLVAGYWLR
jgi:hypothetical protein